MFALRELCGLCERYSLLVLLLGWLWGMLGTMSATEVYYTNRTYSAVEFNIQGEPTAIILHTNALRLTNVVRGAAITILENDTYGLEKKPVAAGYQSAAEAWEAAVQLDSQERHHPGIFDKVGWVRGMRFYREEWGAYLWSLQNHLAFKPSETEVWRSPTNGASVKIIDVIVGSLGIYPPVTPVVDIGPDLSPATNFPGGEVDWNETKMFSADTGNVFYIIAIPVIRIEPRNVVSCAGGSNIEYRVTGSNIPAGVAWALIPNLSGSGGAVIYPSNDWHYASVTPGNIATNYKVRATAMHNTNFFDEVELKVVKVDIAESNVYLGLTNLVSLRLTPESSANVQWEIIPGVQSGAFIKGASRGTSVVVNTGSLLTNYTVRAYAISLTNCFDTCSVAVVIKLVLTNMTFSGGWDLTRDTGGTYPSPHWSPANNSPYLYERSTQVNVTATFLVEPSTFTGNVTILGDGPGNLDFPSVTVSASGGVATYPATNSIGTLANQVDFWNPLAINWKYDFGVASNCDAGSSSNMVYVCLADPSVVPTLYRTIVHLACAVGHATNPDEAVSNTWSQLSGHDFRTRYGRKLYYYKDGAGWDSPGYISQLLNTGNGNCVAWRNLFRHALKVNGVNSDRIYVRVIGETNVFLVGEWIFGQASFTNTPPYNWKLQFATNGPPPDMVPRPPGDVYGNLTSLTNIEGQNTAPPSEKVFGNHRMARYNGVYYDPSYGVTNASIKSFVDTAVDGYAYRESSDPTTNYVIRVKSASGVYEIEELVNYSRDLNDGLP